MATIHFHNRLSELDNVLDLYEDFDRNCEGEFLRVVCSNLVAIGNLISRSLAYSTGI